MYNAVFLYILTQKGTEAIWKELSTTQAFTLIGGGDSITAAHKYNVTDEIDFISTGGGALIRYIADRDLPVLKALRESVLLFN